MKNKKIPVYQAVLSIAMLLLPLREAMAVPSEVVASANGEGFYAASTVAFSEKALIVGDVSDGLNTGNYRYNPQGTVSIYVDSNGDGLYGDNEAKILTAFDGGIGDGFGASVSAEGKRLVVGAPYKGAVYVYEDTNDDGDFTDEIAEKINMGGSVRFGQSVAISGDTLIVGSPLEANYSGAVYAYVDSNGDGRFGDEVRQRLTAYDAEKYDQLGSSIAVAGMTQKNKRTIVIGAFNKDKAKGAAYVFVDANNDGLFTDETALKLHDSTRVNNGQYFAESVAVSNNTIAIGAKRGLNESGRATGIVFIYHDENRDGRFIEAPKRLAPPEPASTGSFGIQLDIEGDALLVSDQSWTNSSQDINANRGRVYLFIDSNGNGDFTDETPQINTPQTIISDATYGRGVKLNEEQYAVNNYLSGLDGNIEIFKKQPIKEWPIDETPEYGVGWFGNGAGHFSASGVALSEQALIVGDSSDGPNTGDFRLNPQGTVSIFVDSDGDGLYSNNNAKILTAFDGGVGDGFGASVAAEGKRLVVGAPYKGAVYIYEDTNGDGDFTDEVAEKINMGGSVRFGQSVAISGDTLIVGAPFEGNYSGAIYAYVDSNGDGRFADEIQQRLAAYDPEKFDQLGSSIAVAGMTQENKRTIVAGAFYKNNQKGAAYVFVDKNNDGLFTDETPLKLYDPTMIINNQYFAESVAISNNTIAIGAKRAVNESGRTTGIVFLYRDENRDGDFIEAPKKLAPPAPSSNGDFGMRLDIEGDSLLVSEPAWIESIQNIDANKGRVYLYIDNNGNGDFTDEIPLVHLPTTPQNKSHFGTKVVLDGTQYGISNSISNFDGHIEVLQK